MPSSLSSFAISAFDSSISVAITFLPLERKNLAMEIPDVPRPIMRKYGKCVSIILIYLIFRVLNEINARVMDIIQNLTITFDSCQPLSSK